MPVFVFSQKSFPIFADRIGLVCGHFVVKSVFESANPCIYWVFWLALLRVGNNSTSLIAGLSVSNIVSLSIP